MSKSKIIVCDHIHETGYKILEEDESIELIKAADVPKDELLKMIAGCDVAITRSSTDVDQNFVNHAKGLKAIVRAGVGVDNVDQNACSKEGIVVMNVPTANTIAAVELTMTHMLSCMRMFPLSHDHLKNQRIWKREKWYGHELKGKKLGIIGFGNIGSRVGIRSKAFEMNVVTYDPYIQSSKATDLDIEYTSNFQDILDCDLITIHTPKNKETIDMINHDEISKMKDGVVLINCARGGLYNEKALEAGLKNGKIRFAGIDVFNKEPAIDNPLLDLDNIIVSPHLGANTFESQRSIAQQAAANAIESAKGISYPNALNLPIKENELPKYVKPYLELIQKIANLSAQANKSPIVSIAITANGNISEYIDSLTTFATVGVMSESVGENVNYVNAEYVAKDRGIKIEKISNANASGYKNRIGVKLTTQREVISICGTVFDENVQRIVEINGFTLDIEPKGKMIILKNSDVPGVIGEIGMTLAKHNINIADFRLGRNGNHNALSMILLDEKVDNIVLDELVSLKACLSVAYVEL